MKHREFNFKSILPTAAAAFGILLAGTAAAQSSTPAAAPGKTVAQLGAVTVGQDELIRMLQALPDAEREAAKANRAGVEGWLRQRLISEALLKEAQSKGWAERPENKARVDAAVRELTTRMVTTGYLESVTPVPAAYPSEAELRAAYDQGKAGFNVPAQYRVAQIFLSAPKSDTAAVAKARDEAKKLAVQARSGNFASIAKSHSQDPRSAERGGEVGMLPLDQLLPEMRETVVKLKVGQVSDPVQSNAGFHVLKVLDSQASHVATFEEIKPRLNDALRQQRQQQLAQAYLSGLAPAGSLSIDGAAVDAALQEVK